MASRDFKALEQRRMRAMRLFLEGETQASVARHVGVSRTTAMRWAQVFEDEGRDGLRSAGRAGRKPRLSAEQLEDVESVLIEGPVAFGYRTEFWTLPRVAEVIQASTGVGYHPGHVWRVLRQMGWSRQKPTACGAKKRRTPKRDDHLHRRERLLRAAVGPAHMGAAGANPGPGTSLRSLEAPLGHRRPGVLVARAPRPLHRALRLTRRRLTRHRPRLLSFLHKSGLALP